MGDPDGGDFDRIIATVGAWNIAPAWRRQLRAGGRLVAPLSLRGPQRSIAFEAAGERLYSTSIENCDFVWLREQLAGPGRRLPLGAASGLSVWLDDDRPVDSAVLYARLRAPAGAQPSGVVTTGPEVFGGLLLWLALHDPGYCEVFHAGSGPDADLVPGLFGVAGRYRRTYGVLAGDTLCLLGATSELPCTRSGRGEPFELLVIGYEGSDAMAARLLATVRRWDTAGRPGTTGLRVRIEPVDAVHTPATGEIVIAKRWHRLVLDWPALGA